MEASNNKKDFPVIFSLHELREVGREEGFKGGCGGTERPFKVSSRLEVGVVKKKDLDG